MAETYDYVVIGAGSSGCIVAAELSADPDARVLLLECGPRAEDHPETLRADGYKHAFANDALIWERFSKPQTHCGNQRLFMGSGRGFGGSGSVNGMVYTRGAREDYDEWPVGWRWQDVQPAFEALEQRLRVRKRAANRFNEAVITAAERAGFRRSEDLNNGDLSGVLGYEFMNYEDGERRSSYVAFLRECLDRPNLTVRSRARVARLVVEQQRVVGVEFTRDGESLRVDVAREAVMCAGALETPKLLMLSGIGPAHHLGELGIDVARDLPAVGENLHDHPNVTLFYHGPFEVDCHYPQLYGFHRANPDLDLPPGQSDTCYVGYPARSSLREAAMRMLPTKLPAWLYGAWSKRLLRALLTVLFYFGFVRRFVERTWGLVVILGKPVSRGRLRLRSARPEDPADIDPAYFRNPQDMATLLKGVKLARRIVQQDPLHRWAGRPLLPGPGVDGDADLQAWIEANAMTTFHYAGTCRMGEDAGSVVDLRLRVRGVTGLRVADASAIPVTPVSALNAPSMMIGYRAAAMIKQDHVADKQQRALGAQGEPAWRA